MTTLRTSAAGRKAIAQHEGNKLTAYQDSVGVWTIGVGHTSAAGAPKVIKGMKITAAQSDEILTRDLQAVEATVNRLVKVPLTQGQFDALVSLVFNIGGTAFGKSTLLKKLNARDYAGAADQFRVWNKGTINGKKVAIKGLTNRRAAERAMFLAEPAKALPSPKPKPSDVYTSQAMVQVVQRKLTALGYPLGSIDPKTGDYDGKLGKLTGDAIAAFRADNGLPAGRDIDAALVAALDTAKLRELPRVDAKPEDITKTIPEAKANWFTKIGSGITALLMAIGAFFNGIIGNLGVATGYIQPVKDAVGDVPGWVWFMCIAAIAGAVYLNSRRVEQKTLQAFQQGARL